MKKILTLAIICLFAVSCMAQERISNRRYNALDARTLITEAILDGDSTIVLQTGSSVILTDESHGTMQINDAAGAIDFTLPAARTGLVIMFYDIVGAVITVDPVDGTDTIYLNGTALTAGNAVDSPAAVGNYLCLMAIDDTRWVTLGQSGVWADGGAD